METVNYCQKQLNFKLHSVTLARRTTCVDKINQCNNSVIKKQYVYNKSVFTVFYLDRYSLYCLFFYCFVCFYALICA